MKCPPMLNGFSLPSSIHILLPIWRLKERCDLLEISSRKRPPDGLGICHTLQECACASQAHNRTEICDKARAKALIYFDFQHS
jgi:hypothetical protein